MAGPESNRRHETPASNMSVYLANRDIKNVLERRIRYDIVMTIHGFNSKIRAANLHSGIVCSTNLCNIRH